MKIKLSKSQWQQIGRTAGWMKQAHIQYGNPLDVDSQLIKDYESIFHALKMSNWNAYTPEIQARIKKLPDPSSLPLNASFSSTIQQAFNEAEQIYNTLHK